MFDKAKRALLGVARKWFTPTPEPILPKVDTQRGINRLWWRDLKVVTPAMAHSLRNDKRFLIAENPLLRGLIARHFKEVA